MAVQSPGAPLPNGLLGSPRLLPGAFGSEQPPVDGVPRCGYGHPVTKCKKLKPWQASLTGHTCAICSSDIQRLEFRWRCSEHCPWDMCQHCYENHWNQVIQEATVVLNRQQRLDLLSAVPLERRHEKDFEAAFGENPEDARLLQPPVQGSALAATAPKKQPILKPRQENPESFDPGESLQLMCPQGHLINKRKKLKPWQQLQILVHGGEKHCNECQDKIASQEFRWRCEHHCDYNVCVDCYQSHWSEILAMVHKMRDEQKCWQMLGAIPLHLRDDTEFQAAKARVNRRAVRENREVPAEGTAMEQQAALSAYGTEAGPKQLKLRIQGAIHAWDTWLEWSPHFEIAFWVVLGWASESRIFARTFWLQGTVSNPIFPHPLLIACISTAIASGFLQFLLLALRIFRRKFGELPPAPAPPPALWPAIQAIRQLHLDAAAGATGRRRKRSRRRAVEAPAPPPLQPQMLHVYLFLGIFIGLETGITWTLWYYCKQRPTLGLHPLAMLLVGLLVGNESRKDHRLLLSMMLASLSGFLIFPAWNASDSEAEIYGMAFAMLAQLLTMARWVFVNAVLPKVHPASDRFAATIVLAANVAVVASTALLELTTVLDFRGYLDILEVEPLSFLLRVSGIGFCVAVKLVAFMNLSRVTSFPFMGILPIIAAVLDKTAGFGFSMKEPPVSLSTGVGHPFVCCVTALLCSRTIKPLCDVYRPTGRLLRTVGRRSRRSLKEI